MSTGLGTRLLNLLTLLGQYAPVVIQELITLGILKLPTNVTPPANVTPAAAVAHIKANADASTTCELDRNALQTHVSRLNALHSAT